jgi:hypothetical protein
MDRIANVETIKLLLEILANAFKISLQMVFNVFAMLHLHYFKEINANAQTIQLKISMNVFAIKIL